MTPPGQISNGAWLVSGLAVLCSAIIATYIVQTTCSLPGATTYAGSQLGSINSLSEIASPRLVLALTFLGLLSLSSVLYRRLTERS